MVEFDRRRALLRNPDFFPRMRAESRLEPLASLDLNGDEPVLVFEVAGVHRAALVRQLCYHHVLQGAIEGEAFVISFCHVCNSAVGLTPSVDGQVHHFSCGGLYNGQSLLIDDETQSYWDPLSGEALHGRLAGKSISNWSVDLTTKGAALSRHRALEVYVEDSRFVAEVFSRFGMFRHRGQGFLPPPFRLTMGNQDPRLDRMERGLGVSVLGEAKFYSEAAMRGGEIVDPWGRRELRVRLRDDDGMPEAEWPDGSRPLQFQMRWYGFAYTYPDCEVYGQEDRSYEGLNAIG